MQSSRAQAIVDCECECRRHDTSTGHTLVDPVPDVCAIQRSTDDVAHRELTNEMSLIDNGKRDHSVRRIFGIQVTQHRPE